MKGPRVTQSGPTFLALAGTSVRCAKHSQVSPRILRARLAARSTSILLVHISYTVAVDAAELRLLGLKVTCATCVLRDMIGTTLEATEALTESALSSHLARIPRKW